MVIICPDKDIVRIACRISTRNGNDILLYITAIQESSTHDAKTAKKYKVTFDSGQAKVEICQEGQEGWNH